VAVVKRQAAKRRQQAEALMKGRVLKTEAVLNVLV
jgi:hypothetical protein